MTKTILETEAAERRSAAERAIARYPAMEPDEVATLVRYIRKEASALDRASIASNPELQERYRQLCYEHRIDRLRPFEIALVVAGVVAFVAIIAAVYML
jgi:hypothetical protein